MPGGGSPDGGYGAAYAAWAASCSSGCNNFGSGGYSYGYSGGCGSAGCEGGKEKGACKGKGKGKDKGKGKGKDKGKGKGKGFTGFPAGGDFNGSPLGPSSMLPVDPSDPRRQIELAQRRAKQRDRCSISQAQRSAQQRFERDLLDRVQGCWVDESDPTTTYEVNGSMCLVTSGDTTRVFRNRISTFGGELCWDAKRFWHYLDLSSLPPVNEQVERVEWNPGEGSPPTRTIVWLRTEAPPPKVDGDEVRSQFVGYEGDGGGQSMSQSV